MKLKKPGKIKVPEQAVFPIQINVHNLMINPGDVPNDYEVVSNDKGERVFRYDGDWYIYYDEFDTGGNMKYEPPKLWYDIPEFDVDKTELEKLSKEELIELILKERGEK